MSESQFDLVIEEESVGVAGTQAGVLATQLREISGVISARQTRPENQISQDLGSIVAVLASASATGALAQGIAFWLRARRNARLKIIRKAGSESVKVYVQNIDPEIAGRIVETVMK